MWALFCAYYRSRFLVKKDLTFCQKKASILWYKAYFLQFRYLFPVKKDLCYRHKTKQNYYFQIVPQKTGIFLILSFENDTSFTGVISFWSPSIFFEKGTGWQVLKSWRDSYIYIKNVLTNFLWVWNFGQVGGPDKKNQKHPLGRIFLKSV